jgi:hypothetical protein
MQQQPQRIPVSLQVSTRAQHAALFLPADDAALVTPAAPVDATAPALSTRGAGSNSSGNMGLVIPVRIRQRPTLLRSAAGAAATAGAPAMTTLQLVDSTAYLATATAAAVSSPAAAAATDAVRRLRVRREFSTPLMRYDLTRATAGARRARAPAEEGDDVDGNNNGEEEEGALNDESANPVAAGGTEASSSSDDDDHLVGGEAGGDSDPENDDGGRGRGRRAGAAVDHQSETVSTEQALVIANAAAARRRGMRADAWFLLAPTSVPSSQGAAARRGYVCEPLAEVLALEPETAAMRTRSKFGHVDSLKIKCRKPAVPI